VLLVESGTHENDSRLNQKIPNTVRSQNNGAVSKVNKKSTSQLTRIIRIPPAATAVKVSHVLPAVRFSCLLRGRGVSIQDGVAAGKAFCVIRFEVSRSVITVQREFRERYQQF
jgi:hypothetical protein